MSLLKIVHTEKDIKQLIQNCKATRYASVDFETTSLKYYSPSDYPLMLGCSFQPGSAWIIPLQHKESPLRDKWKPLFDLFCREVVENKDIVKVGWNFKFEYKWFLRYGYVPQGYLLDSMLAKYCLDEEPPHDLKSFVDWVFPKYAGYENEIKGNNWADKPFNKLAPYCGIDCDLELRSAILLEPKLIKLDFYKVFRNILMMTTRVLAESEFRGMKVDKEYLYNLMMDYKKRIADVDYKMRNLPQVKRFEIKTLEYHKQKLIDELQEEITLIENGESKQKDRMIQFREDKISRIVAGNLQGKKEEYNGLNLNSPVQLRDFLYEPRGLGLPIVKYTKDKNTKKDTETPSTDEEALLKLKRRDKSGFIKILLKHRGLVKLDSTYISGMYPRLDENNIVHASFKIPGTVTGRLSCEDPNLQNIPRDTTASDIKRMFVAPAGYLLMEVDYGQAELRIIAELSGDKAMIEIFKKNYNVHVATACKMNKCLERYDEIKNILKIADAMSGKDLEKPENKEYLFWAKQKKKGKSLNFSIVYQQGPEATAETLGCSVDQAKKFQSEWFKQFPGVKRYIDKVKRQVREDEYVMSIFGRKRRLPDANSPIKGFQAKAERDAINAPIQSGSGDFTLFSSIILRDKILRGELPQDFNQAYTVHDSIGFWIQPKDIHQVVPIVTKVCNNPETQKYFGFQLKDVEMKVSCEIGKHWAGLGDYEPKEDYKKKYRDVLYT